ncbi:high-potential iron-sulfur protein [Paraburkholderia rhizosphaerae]|uniref:High-potential iron-sulfur protein n=1 Tax=Paraburkholderia rhizosphaerae TaxID=480658 RepID=A0A4R8LEK3_9BURK|nr:high-potential iron-sulfur protein [Paraburkholderia rhizosphaerae]TDY40579.1 high potential iron-sulfur protein [Paraburkholderia rhizosphaerae]
MSASRRAFVISLAGLASNLFLVNVARADGTPVSESDPAAMALGYKANASQVDKAKFKNYMPGDKCSNCQFYQGAASAASAPCPLLGGKLVLGEGWCQGYAKKA